MKTLKIIAVYILLFLAVWGVGLVVQAVEGREGSYSTSPPYDER